MSMLLLVPLMSDGSGLCPTKSSKRTVSPDVEIVANGERQSTPPGQEGDRATDGRLTPCPDGEASGDSPKDQVAQQFNQCEAKCSKTMSVSVSTTLSKGKVRCRLVSLLNPERLREAKVLVEKAVKMHKVFSIHGPYPVIREALRARGWIEQRVHRPYKRAHRRHRDESRLDKNADDVDEEQDLAELDDLMSRLVRNEMVYFYWTRRSNALNPSSLQKEQITNHFANGHNLTTKAGLCVNLRNLHWFDSTDPDAFFPRCYRLGAQDEKHAFIEDYRRTACTSLLKYIVEREQGVQEEGTSRNIWAVRDQRKQSKHQSGPVVLSKIIDKALKVCQEFLDSVDHSDIDIGLESQQILTTEDWTQFIDSYYLVVHDGAEIEITDHLVTRCEAMLQKMGEVNPQLDIGGTHNIWIIKPGAKSRGRDIQCAKRLDQILRLVNSDPTLIKESKWVVQKYLERPLLVHGTKFDLRQWFLVSDWNPLTVWFYKKCYLRFSTQPYSLHTLDSSVHLCNNSIQRHLRPSKKRHRDIPADNMWSGDQFETYLSSQGRGGQWETVVVPEMKAALIHALQTTQDVIESRKNSFELYGADFMLGHDLCPWLIEVNASPTMVSSTPVTAQLCTAVQRDTLRVVLDWRVDSNANTGDFQLIYRHQSKCHSL
ncbi:tubulin monoglycylase TTLL3-like isoform X3 [Scophthalmus maximus]|uniref:tubulin monoglycylase TTLL3-like isoform X3 n=1 Tax=Scophthalmus maximus TaxID=52904 RepID=UPI001FA85F57|nr:tubulin monoglycylase TTLL3-like isoform X3 [Scophthalmus maximus]